MIANLDVYSKKSKEVYDEIWNTIVEKNKNMWLGYTKENIKKANDYKKELKIKAKDKL